MGPCASTVSLTWVLYWVMTIGHSALIITSNNQRHDPSSPYFYIIAASETVAHIVHASIWNSRSHCQTVQKRMYTLRNPVRLHHVSLCSMCHAPTSETRRKPVAHIVHASIWNWNIRSHYLMWYLTAKASKSDSTHYTALYYTYAYSMCRSAQCAMPRHRFGTSPRRPRRWLDLYI